MCAHETPCSHIGMFLVTAYIAPLFALTSRCFGRRYVWSYARYCRGHVT